MEYLSRASAGLNGARGVRVVRLSSVYETEPGGLAGPAPLPQSGGGGRHRARPPRAPEGVSSRGGGERRVRLIRWGPRTLDIDLLLYDDLEMDTPELVIPHPRMLQRAFVLAPLVEIER